MGSVSTKIAHYLCLSQQKFEYGIFKIIPVQMGDRFQIMKWRNEQIEILRQENYLTENDQNFYFENIVSRQFGENHPNQLLFSYYENEILIGYGGLVHIDWKSKNAELSFIIDTYRNKDIDRFKNDLVIFLNLISRVCFDDLKFKKLHTTVYEIENRAPYIEVIKEFGFILEGNLKNHIYINGEFKNLLIFSYFNLC